MCFGCQQPHVYCGESILREPQTIFNFSVPAEYPILRLWVSLLSLELYPRLVLNQDCACSPFHAGLGVATGRLLLHLRKFATDNLEARGDSRTGSCMTGVLPHLEVALADPEITR